MYLGMHSYMYMCVYIYVCMYDNDKRGHELEREHGGVRKKIQWEEKEQGKLFNYMIISKDKSLAGYEPR